MPVMQKDRYAPPVHIIRTETREITPYLWVHPDEERQMKMESRRNGSPHATDAAGFLDLVRRH